LELFSIYAFAASHRSPFSDELYTKENPFTLTDQIKAGRFDYPSPYWDSVGDPALDLIDRMLTVEMEKRYTIDECLEHPWMQNKTASTSSTLSTSDSLVGGISSLNLSKRKVVRERTLLSSINDVKVTPVIKVGPLMDPVEYVKNPNLKATASSPGNKRTFAPTDDQFEPPAKLFTASADLGADRSRGISSSSSNLPSLFVPSKVVSTADIERQNLKGNQTNPLSATDESVFSREEGSPSDSSNTEFKKLQALDVATNDKVTQEPQSKDSMRIEQPSPGPGLLSHDPQNILPSESSELISTQGYQPKSLLDSSDEASASTGATDVSSPDLNITYSDDEDVDSPLEEYDLGGRSLERRLIDPEGYFQDLRDLEKEVIINSGLELLIKSKPSALKDPRAELSKPRADVPIEEAMLLNNMARGRSTTIWNVLFRCGEIMECCCSNIERLQKAGFCDKYITVIAEDIHRSTVAKLHKVSTKIIFELLENFREVQTRSPGIIVNLYRQIVLSCVEVLSRMGMSLSAKFEYIPESTFLFFTERDESMLATLQATVEALDLLVISYSGTHIRKFNHSQSYPYQDHLFFALPGINSEDKEQMTTPVICLRRRRLMCMDAFLGGHKVWVFQQGCDVSRNEPLWLSTGIEELNDIWGPGWKLLHDKEHSEIQSIEIGNGCILPWSGPLSEDNPSNFPLIDDNEVYSHWISSKDWDDAVVQKGQQDLDRKYFTEDSTFLIGASPYIGLAVNPSCKPSKSDLVWKKTRLEEKNALRIPKTSYARRFKDSHSYQITANIPIAGSHTQALSYKRKEGLDRKSAFVERWRNNSGNPGELEDFSGVEVSICTQNACRMRLLSILGSDTMRDYLHGISFSWPTKRFETDYFEAMKSRRKFRKFWNRHLLFSNKISSAISICLDILQTTGVNHDNGELGALWVAEFEDEKYQDYSDDDDESDDDMSDARSDSASRHASFTGSVETRMPFKKVEEVIVTLFRSEYTWTSFLRDSPETITMAIVTSGCLEAIDDRALGRRCKRGWWEDGKYITVRGFPVIQTSLFVNEAILESSQLVSERVPGRSRGCPSYRVWNTEGLQESSRFSLGDHGTLEVTVLPTKCCPVTIMAWGDLTSSTWNEIKEVGFNEQLLGRSREPHHKEHISGVWETQPLPVLIMSKSKKETIL
jgi:serine/threonine protein kinase